jgi:hypothetical protein
MNRDPARIPACHGMPSLNLEPIVPGKTKLLSNSPAPISWDRTWPSATSGENRSRHAMRAGKTLAGDTNRVQA